MATPPTFSAGAVLTAAQMNAIGLWLVKTQTIGSGVASVEVTGAFSSDYDAYRIILTGGVASVQCDLKLTLGATATGYYYGLVYNAYNASAVLGVAGANTTSWVYAGTGTTSKLDAVIDLRDPYSAKNTTISSWYTQTATTGAQGNMNGYLANTTSYTAFTITPNTGTMTGGTIRVYGYRN